MSTPSPDPCGNEGLQSLPAFPTDEDGPVFQAPWQAHAFALVVELVDAGQFSWQEWAAALGQQLHSAAGEGLAEDGSHYYHHWVAALEQLLNTKHITQLAQLTRVKHEWADAYKSTPHGKPVELKPSD